MSSADSSCFTQSFNGASTGEVAQLQARLAAMEKLHQELAADHAATNGELDEARRRAAQLSDDSTATIIELKERVRTLERVERNASEGQRYAEARVEGLKRELEAARSVPGGDGPWGNKMRALEAAVAEYKGALDALQDEAAEVEARVARGAGLVKAAALEEAEARVSELEGEKAELEGTVEELTKANTALDADIAELMRRVASGEYNAERERVLELRDNPAARVNAVRRVQLDDLRTENAALLARLKELDTTPSEGGSGLVPRASYARLEKERDAAAAAHEKRLLRLKEIFGHKSREFLEAVYSLLGWRIKFEENGGELRLTSMYAPKGKMGLTLKFTSDEGHFGTMHMSGAMKRGLEEAHQFWVVERQSIPGFLAQVTTEMFEKTTVSSRLAVLTSVRARGGLCRSGSRAVGERVDGEAVDRAVDAITVLINAYWHTQSYISPHSVMRTVIFGLASAGLVQALSSLVLRAGGNVLDLAHGEQPVDDAPEHAVLVVEELGGRGGDKELAPVRPWPRVGHREQSRSRVLDREILVIELCAVYRERAGAVVADEVAAWSQWVCRG